mmetsp:Transcript_547/g.979  ORF Transcript_547/g.979 Transcript_547/m.979 type:complete len:246 (-) Transcript_547:953-1690(-)
MGAVRVQIVKRALDGVRNLHTSGRVPAGHFQLQRTHDRDGIGASGHLRLQLVPHLSACMTVTFAFAGCLSEVFQSIFLPFFEAPLFCQVLCFCLAFLRFRLHIAHDPAYHIVVFVNGRSGLFLLPRFLLDPDCSVEGIHKRPVLPEETLVTFGPQQTLVTFVSTFVHTHAEVLSVLKTITFEKPLPRVLGSSEGSPFKEGIFIGISPPPGVLRLCIIFLNNIGERRGTALPALTTAANDQHRHCH